MPTASAPYPVLREYLPTFPLWHISVSNHPPCYSWFLQVRRGGRVRTNQVCSHLTPSGDGCPASGPTARLHDGRTQSHPSVRSQTSGLTRAAQAIRAYLAEIQRESATTARTRAASSVIESGRSPDLSVIGGMEPSASAFMSDRAKHSTRSPEGLVSLERTPHVLGHRLPDRSGSDASARPQGR